ncbi:DNA replication ATP-dependent helicase/nuclease DNA2 isoform X4 [Anthonomus grandis grandis]|uniref:DNA replication ATP-dependent helicase/nuclease DNA2 isoform X4 n=1 Tax=Anthonomus grandis grandis TaxID=2921223 RepID=UPI0021657912|nr:DNA replication ATP-dependent helicase/nuclease DNA2 isoform X4 [Anthonomus grandis grandis]
MKKATPKSKVPQGCMKISSFFTTVRPKSDKSLHKPEQIVIIDDGDNAFEDCTQSLLAIQSKRKGDNATTGNSPPKKKTHLKPHPSASGITTNIQQSRDMHVSGASNMLPSVSGSTPITTKPLLTVKTPEKLFNPESLKSLQSSPKHLTPEKQNSKTKVGSSKKKLSGSKTPKKLFESSPSNLSEFNVEVIKNFFKITPTKREVEDRNREVQRENEKTPIKHVMPPTVASPRVKTKLDFDSGTESLCCKQNPTAKEKENHDSSNLSFTFDDASWEADFIDRIDYNLDLSTSQHCKVVSVVQHATETIITVKSTQTSEQALCSLKGFWMESKVCIGDIIRITASKVDENWFIDNNDGSLVLEPDLLISCTSVVNSVFCKRRSVFKERFRGFDTGNKFMVLGSMVHVLTQEVLKNKLYQLKQINQHALDILSRREWVKQIYESGDSLKSVSEEFLQYVPKISDFVNKYVKNASSKKEICKGNWQGVISEIQDIEDNIWCPELGVKGKVDISVRHEKTLMPLEIKTGRASVSLEHRGQVLLYIMMMKKLGCPVSSGLLLYLKEGVLREIPPSAAEQRDLIILRNELAYYILKQPTFQGSGEEVSLNPGEIPEAINHPACGKCPYSGVCMAYSKYLNEDVSSKVNLRKAYDEVSASITAAHIDYFMHWNALLSLETPERAATKDLRDIFTLTPEERHAKGKCLINLKVKELIEDNSGVCFTTFHSSLTGNFLLSGLTENAYLVVSVKNRPAIASGIVTDITMDQITLSLDRNVQKKYPEELFFLDSYDSSAFLTYNLSSLSLILEPDEKAHQLRRIIVDKQPASFQTKLPMSLLQKAKPILKRLNKVQQRAVLKAIAANEYFLIKGMPGTGKTATIVALIQLLVEIGKSVLITSHTHSAVDTVCLKLISFGVKFMRLGSEAKMNPDIRAYSEYYLTKDCHSPEALETVYNSVQVFAVTCLGSGNMVLSKRVLDVCIVDESTQVVQCSVIRPLYAAKTFVLLGDPDQLPATIKNKTAIEKGMAESLFERLDSDEARISLNLNYRMNKSITKLANVLTYKGELEIGSERVAEATMDIPKRELLLETYKKDTWLIKALDAKMENAVQFVDTGPTWDLNKSVPWADNKFDSNEMISCANIYEAAIVYRLVKALIIEGAVPPSHIGVIATYRIQVALLTQLLESTEVCVNTVDQYQGKDCNIIIYSCSKSRDLKREWVNKFDLTEDKRRLNVAITRAKHKLIIVGDLATLGNYSTFKRIKNELESNAIKLLECDGFSWDEILRIS